MSTANLSVGIKTEGARAELAALKAELKSLGTSVKVQLDDSDLTKTLQKERALKLSVQTRTLSSEIDKAVASGLGKVGRRVLVDTVQLTADVSGAIGAAFGAARIKIGDESYDRMARGVRDALIRATKDMPVLFNQNLFRDSVQGALRLGLAGSDDAIRKQVSEALTTLDIREINAKVGVDRQHLVNELSAILTSLEPEVRVSANRLVLIKSIESALDSVFDNVYTVRVNASDVTEKVRAAMAAGMAGVPGISTGSKIKKPARTVAEIQDEVERLNEEALALVTRGGVRPKEGSDKRARFDEIARRIDSLANSELPSAESYEKTLNALKLNIDEGFLRSQVAAALATEHKLNIDTAHLIAQIKTGLGAAKLPVSAVGTAAAAVGPVAGVTPALMRDVMAPLMDQLAGTIDDAFKGIKASSPALRPTREQLQAARVGPSRQELFAAQDRFTLDKAKAATPVDARTLLGLPSEREVKGASNQIKAQLLQARDLSDLTARSAPKLDERTLLGLPSRDEMKSFSAQLRAQMVEARDLSNLTFRSAPKLDARTVLGLPSRDEMKSFSAQLRAQMAEARDLSGLKAKSAPKIDARTVLGLPSDAEMQSFSTQLKAQMAAQARDSQEAMTRFYEQAKARAGDRFEGRGASIVAAQQLRTQFGEEQARGFLGPKKSFLLDESDFEKYRRGVASAGLATRGFSGLMNEGHSAARGFAGALGQLWLTWGSTLPLIAGAALGASIRSVFQTGRELEYQLKFVAVLTDAASISMTDFANAVRGTQVAPVEAAEAMRGLAQNGLDATEALRALPTILRLATVGEMELGEAALGATGVMAAFNLGVEDLGRVGDVFAKAAAESNTSVQSMVESMRQASTVSDKYKVSLEEAGAALATLAKRNIVGSAAGTAFRNMMTDIATPTRKAKEAMKNLGLELYDSNNQLKGFQEVLRGLREATIGLNEKGKLTFLADLFDERGAKAANALLSDYKLFGELLDELQNKAGGFTQKVVAELNDTTSGRIKRLLAEFQLSTSEAFLGAKNGIDSFIDSLRGVAASAEFKAFLQELTTGVVDLTRYVVENAGAITKLVAAWVALSALGAVVTTVGSLVTALKALEFTLVGVRIAALGAWGAMTGGIGLVALLALQYFSLKTTVSETGKALEAKRGVLAAQNQDLDRSISAMEASNKVLREETSLIWAGVDAIRAKTQAQRNLSGQAIEQEGLDNARTLAGLRRQLVEEEARYSSRTGRPEDAGRFKNSRAEQLRKEIKDAEEIEAAIAARAAKIPRADAAEREQTELVRAKKAAEALQNYVQSVKEINKQGKLQFEIPDLQALRQYPVEDQEAFAEYLEAEKNKRLGNYTPVDPSADAASRREALSIIKQEIQAYEQRFAVLRESMDYESKLDEIRFGSIAPLLAQARAYDNVARSIEFQERELKKLTDTFNEQKAAKKLKPEDTTNFETKKRDIEGDLEKLRRQQAFSVREAQEKDRAEQLKAEKDFRKQLQDLDRGDRSDLAKVSERVRIAEIEDPVQRIGEEAARQKLTEYARDEFNIEQRIEDSLDKQAQLREELKYVRDQDADSIYRAIAAQDVQIAVEKARLQILKDQGKAASEVARAQAEAHERYARSAAAGWNNFWAEYERSAYTSAKAVGDALGAVMGSAESGFMRMVETGKVSLKGLGAELERIAARKMFNDLIKPGLTEVVKKVGGIFGINVGGSKGDDGAAAAAAANFALADSAMAAATALNQISGLSGLSGGLSSGGSGGGLLGGLGGVAGDIWEGFGDAFISIFGAKQGAVFGVERFGKGGAFTNGIFSQPTPFRFRKGGMFAAGEMGEAGTEAVMPLERGPDGSLGVVAYGSAAPAQAPVFNLHIHGAPSTPDVQRRRNASGGEDVFVRFKEQVKSEVADDFSGNGPIARSAGNRFGLNPGAGLVV